MSDLPEHLKVTASERGFCRLPKIPSAYDGDIEAYESSAALAPHIWLTARAPEILGEPNGPWSEAPMHLTAESAWRLAEQLMLLVQEHYQGDSRPEVRVYDRVVPAEPTPACTCEYPYDGAPGAGHHPGCAVSHL